jgi:putative oxidoreductase
MCAILILIFATGVALIHWHLGFFIIGPGEGGWEFSALLIACFAAVALDYGPAATLSDFSRHRQLNRT